MREAYYKHSSLTAPISFNNQPRSTPMWMYVTGTLGHIPRHPSRTSPKNNNNKHTTDFTLVLIMNPQT